jgi:hypothetical protein
MHHVAHRLGEDKEESRQPNAGKHQEQQVDTSKITPTLRKSLSLLRQTLWKPFRKSAMELDLLPWTGTAPSASSCLAQDALWDRGGHHHIRRSSSRERGHLVLHLLLSCAIADFFRVVIFACHYSRATRPALSQQSGEPPPRSTPPSGVCRRHFVYLPPFAVTAWKARLRRSSRRRGYS